MKHIDQVPDDDPELSPPARGRGLKRALGKDGKLTAEVAPRAGAWIET